MTTTTTSKTPTSVHTRPVINTEAHTKTPEFNGYLDLSKNGLYKSFKSESREDLLSETGTYIIETDDNNNKSYNNNGVNNSNVKNSTNNDDIEVRTQRIDQVFGLHSNSSLAASVDTDLTPRNTTINTSKLDLKLLSSSTSPSISSTESDNTTRRSMNDSLTPRHDDTATRCSVNTNLLLGNTDDLVRKLKNDKKDVEALSTRALVNGGQIFQNNGGLSFSVDLENSMRPRRSHWETKQSFDESLNNKKTPTITLELNRPKNALRASADTTVATETNYTTTHRTEQSLGTRIQNAAKQNGGNNTFPRRSSVSSDKDASTASGVSSMVTNRTLLLRQQSARAKRDSSASSVKTAAKGALVRSTATLNDSLKVTTAPRSSSRATAPKTPQSSSRNASPCSTARAPLQQHTAAKDAFMRRKAYDPLKSVESERIKQKLQKSASSVQPSSRVRMSASKQEADDDESLISNSSIDLRGPIERLKTSISSDKQSANNLNRSSSLQVANSSGTVTKSKYQQEPKTIATDVFKKPSCLKRPKTALELNKIHSSESNDDADSDVFDEDNETRFNSLPNSLKQNGEATTGDTSNCESLLGSTVQRLCIRMIKTATSVLDKIDDSNNLLSIGSNEQERFQKLAKLVHSIQLINDHIQTIDSSISVQTPKTHHHTTRTMNDTDTLIDLL